MSNLSHPIFRGLLLGVLLCSAGCPGGEFGGDDASYCLSWESVVESGHVLLRGPGDVTTWRVAASFSGAGDSSADFSRHLIANLSVAAATNAPETSEGYIELILGPTGAASPWVRERFEVVAGNPSMRESVYVDFVAGLDAHCMGQMPCPVELEVGFVSFTSAVVSIDDVWLSMDSGAVEGRYGDCGVGMFIVDTGPEPLVPVESGDTDSDGVETEPAVPVDTESDGVETEGTTGGS